MAAGRAISNFTGSLSGRLCTGTAGPEKGKEDVKDAMEVEEVGKPWLSCRCKGDDPSALESALELTLCERIGEVVGD